MALYGMSDNGVEIPAEVDGALYNLLAGDEDYVIKGIGDEFKVTYSSSSLTITLGSGVGVLCGRTVQETDGTTKLTLSSSSSGYIVIRFDKNQAEGEQVSLKAVSSTQRANINNTGKIADLILYSYTTSASGVSAMASKRNIQATAGGLTTYPEIGILSNDPADWRNYTVYKNDSTGLLGSSASTTRATTVSGVKVTANHTYMLKTNVSGLQIAWNVTKSTTDLTVVATTGWGGYGHYITIPSTGGALFPVIRYSDNRAFSYTDIGNTIWLNVVDVTDMSYNRSTIAHGATSYTSESSGIVTTNSKYVANDTWPVYVDIILFVHGSNIYQSATVYGCDTNSSNLSDWTALATVSRTSKLNEGSEAIRPSLFKLGTFTGYHYYKVVKAATTGSNTSQFFAAFIYGSPNYS